MKQTLKKLLSLMLCVVFVAGVLPMTAGAETITEYSQGDIIEFGWYPQTKVTDSRILAHLNAVAPAWESWTSYGYYSGTGMVSDGQMKPGDFMRYTDIVVDGVKYRGVKFTSYRPYCTGYVSSDAYYSDQDESGYYVGNTYWFRFDPLRWRVLDPAAGLVLCETVIDSQAYSNYIVYDKKADPYGHAIFWGNAEKTRYANNYAESDIRQWLNDAFYTTAFSAAQQGILQTTALDNKAYSTDRSAYDAASTNDKIFLLSYSDILNTQYGFSASVDEKDAARSVKATDYAKCQGVYVSQWTSNSSWRLRSAGIYTDLACVVNTDGVVFCNSSVGDTSFGIRPACKFDLTAEILQPSVEIGSAPVHTMTSTVTAPTCTEKGYTTHACQDCTYTYTDNEVNVNPDNHTGTADWTKTATTHEKQWSCCKAYAVKSEAHKWTDGVCADCGYVCAHTGGEATCTEQAACEIFDEHYGELNPDNHTGTAEWTTTATTHEKQWSCCKAYAVESEAHKWTDGVCTDCGYVCVHTGGEANCTEKAVCEICHEHYGETVPKHDYTAWTPVESEDGTSVEHTRTCTRCGDTQTAPHHFTDWETKSKSTFFEDGQDVRTCTVCAHTEYRLVYSTVNRILNGLAGFGLFLVAVMLSPFFWIIKTTSPDLYQQLLHALTGK